MVCWFRNLIAYRLAGEHSLTAEKIAAALAVKKFIPAGQADIFSAGWVAPIKSRPDDFAFASGGAVLATLQIESKLLPAGVINAEADRRAEKIEKDENRKVGRGELRHIKEQVTAEFLPKAFTTTARQRVIIDLQSQMVLVEASSAAKAEFLLSLLRETLGELPTRLLQTKFSPEAAMSNWLGNGSPENFTIDAETAFENAAGSAKGKVQLANVDLTSDLVRQYFIQSGMVARKLAMSWADKVGGTITEKLEFKKLTMLDILGEKAQEIDRSMEDLDALVEANFLLLVGTLREYLPAVFAAMGGELGDLYDTQAEPSNVVSIASRQKDQASLPWEAEMDDAVLMAQAETLVKSTGRASISSIQREFRIGYNRAARILEALEVAGVVSEMDQSGRRKVLAA